MFGLPVRTSGWASRQDETRVLVLVPRGRTRAALLVTAATSVRCRPNVLNGLAERNASARIPTSLLHLGADFGAK